MLDEKRIRQMTKLAFFKKKEEKNVYKNSYPPHVSLLTKS